MTTKTYVVEVTREADGKWSARATNAAGAHTWAKALEGIDTRIREAIALAEDLADDVDLAGLQLLYRYDIGDPAVVAAAAELRAERAQLEAVQQRLVRRTRAAAHHLAGKGISNRDSAILLGVSHQLISHLLNPKERPSRAAAAPPPVPVPTAEDDDHADLAGVDDDDPECE